MKHLLLISLLTVATLAAAKDYRLKSPDGRLTVTVEAGHNLRWSIDCEGTAVLLPSAVAWNDAHDFGAMRRTPDGARFTAKNGTAIEFRVYNDGAAYRWLAGHTVDVVESETSEYRFAGDYGAFVPYVNDNRGGERWCYSFESYYDEQRLSEMYDDSLAVTPLAVSLPNGLRAVVMDAGVTDYPGMFLTKAPDNTLRAAFAPYPLETKVGGFNRLNLVPVRRANDIARQVQGTPWRAVVVTRNDRELAYNDMSRRLAPACRIGDTSWVRPGKVAWDWWNNTNLTGVDFEAGINTPTYKYYIDFAQRNGIEYVIIDEGWSDPEDLKVMTSAISVPELLRYARERGVGIILWTSWRNLVKDLEGNMAHYARMGVKGFKVDFFDRDDQQAILSACAVAECAARHHLLLDFHGLKPGGLQYAYPNILNFEGVKGLENSKWEPRTAEGPVHDQPRYDVTIPYLRMLCGPLDYTPGAMRNAVKSQFFGNNDHPMSQGTRVHQMAMYVVFDAPLQMMADSPTAYEHNADCAAWIAAVPTVWDETRVLDGRLGEYIVVARRRGAEWFVAAMTNWQPRTLPLDLSSLGLKATTADVFQDGINAHRDATDHKHLRALPDTIRLAPGGGWVARLK